jgi:hypothetical protein
MAALPSGVHMTDNNPVAVDQTYYWQPMATCPLSVKVQLLGRGGVAIYGQFSGHDSFVVGWAPLPNKPDWMKT